MSKIKLRPLILRLWQDSATSPEEPDNEHLAQWVGHILQAEDAYRRQLKDAHQKLHSLRETLKTLNSLPAPAEPHPSETVVGAAVGHLSMAIGALRSTQRRITGDYVSPERKLDPLLPLDDAIARVKDAKKLLTGEPVEPCPGGCGVDLGHPGNPDRQCACPKWEPRTWEQLTEVESDDLPLMVEVRPDTGFITVWRRTPASRDFENNGRTLRLEQLRYLGTVREVPS